VELLSSSALRNKSSLPPEVILMIPSAAYLAAKKGRHGRTATVAIAIGMIAMATDPNARCSLRYALSVAKLPRFRSSPTKIGQCIVAIATIRSGQADPASLLLKAYTGQAYLICVCPFNNG